MIEYITTRKTVGLEELAAEFHMKTAEAIEKVQFLEQSGRVSGVMDDRGKVCAPCTFNPSFCCLHAILASPEEGSH